MIAKQNFSISSRRGFLRLMTMGLATAGLIEPFDIGRKGAGKALAQEVVKGGAGAQAKPSSVAFYGDKQAGIITPQQSHVCFCAIDLKTDDKSKLINLLRLWTVASARLAQGLPTADLSDDLTVAASDSGDVLELDPAKLTLTFGFGRSLFFKDGKDRFGLARHCPEALVDMPVFHGDQLIEARTGGDLCIQACANDPQIAFHAIRELARLGSDIAEIRWVQTGFLPESKVGDTPRNLMGFKDGTRNPGFHAETKKALQAGDKDFDETIWVGPEGPKWMQGGSYMVARRIRMSLERWEKAPVDFQEEVMGRHKRSGAPIGAAHEFDKPDFDVADKDGNPHIAETSHLRLASPETNGGIRIFRRGYNYNEGVSFTAERWPPWRQGMLYDAGLFFIAFQRDPRTGFISLFENMAKFDALNQYTTHVGSGLFACPPGAGEGRYIGQSLFED